MTEPTKPNLCGELANFRYTWPGRDEDVICSTHADKLMNVAAAIGCHVQLIPITSRTVTDAADWPTCTQITKDGS